MTIRKILFIGCLLVFAMRETPAQIPIQNFKLTNVVDGSPVTLDSYSTTGLVILFTSNVCPYDGYYTARIKHLIDVYQGKIQFLLINSFQEPDESVEKMKSVYGSWTLSVPYLADKDQVAMNILSARKSPEAFLIKNSGGKFEVVYSGAIDDNAQVSAAVTENHLRTAIDQLLNNQPIESPVVRTVGCSIRKK